MKLRQRPHKSLVGINSNFPTSIPCLSYWELPPDFQISIRIYLVTEWRGEIGPPLQLGKVKNQHVSDFPIASSSELFEVHGLCIFARFRDNASNNERNCSDKGYIRITDHGMCKQRSRTKRMNVECNSIHGIFRSDRTRLDLNKQQHLNLITVFMSPLLNKQIVQCKEFFNSTVPAIVDKFVLQTNSVSHRGDLTSRLLSRWLAD